MTFKNLYPSKKILLRKNVRSFYWIGVVFALLYPPFAYALDLPYVWEGFLLFLVIDLYFSIVRDLFLKNQYFSLNKELMISFRSGVLTKDRNHKIEEIPYEEIEKIVVYHHHMYRKPFMAYQENYFAEVLLSGKRKIVITSLMSEDLMTELQSLPFKFERKLRFFPDTYFNGHENYKRIN